MSRRPFTALRAGLAGLLAAALTLGVAELVAAFVHPGSSPVLAVGSTIVDGSPAWLKDFAIRTFGAYDKTVLVAGVVVVLALCAVALGRVAVRNRLLGVAGVTALGAAGAAAAVTRRDATAAWALPSVLATVAGALALYLLADTLARQSTARRAAAVPAGPDTDTADRGGLVSAHPAGADTGTADRGGPVSADPAPPSRRGFLTAGIGVVVVAAATGGAGRLLSGRRFAVSSSRAGTRLPPPDSPASPVPPGAGLDVPGAPSFFTRNAEFYRVDTVLALPSVPSDEWSLRVHGMVNHELTLSYDDLLARPLIERDITLACVSNPVGGPYVGNARWLGVRLADLLDEAGVLPEADEVFSRSADGWTCGTPTATIMDGRDAMLAVAMNGRPLPVAHGYPVRIVVPGLYGYVSATKWVVDIELTRFTRKKPYWATRGWALKAPVNTMSRIDTPRPGDTVRSGQVAVAGVAWAQHRGVKRVEVRVDGGPWREARLAPVPSADTWRQWVHHWDAGAGDHQLQVRATDGRGRTQTPRETPPAPDGATGWHTINVTAA